MTRTRTNTAARVATYARYSRDMQKESSIEDQQRNCKRRADSEGWKIVEQYADRAISGSDSRRPQYQAMLRAAARGEFDVLLIDDQSRLTRDAAESERTHRKLDFHGVRVIAVSDGYDSTSKSSKVHRGFKAIMNETFLDDLREKVHRGQEGQALKGRWNGGRVYGYTLRKLTDPTRTDAFGDPVKIGTKLEIDPKQAKVVREIFDLYIGGMSYRAIAAELNARNVPSVGTTWKRKKHRGSGWMSGAVRAMLLNPRYTGQQTWNTHQFVRNPETEKFVRRARPKSEWVIQHDESLRIISDAVFAKAQARRQIRSNADARLKKGGKLKYLLSGLLKCYACGASYVMSGKTSAKGAAKYACSSYVNGGASACANRTRVRMDVLEREIIGPIKDDLLSPERVERMAKEIEKGFAERMKARQQKGVEAPRELAELDARLDLLRTRLREGDPAMTEDELVEMIAKVEAKRAALAASLAPARASAKVLSMLPRAAALYRQQIIAGLSGHPEKVAQARNILRQLIGTVTIKTERDGSVWGEFEAQPAVLLGEENRSGRGEAVYPLFSAPFRVNFG